VVDGGSADGTAGARAAALRPGDRVAPRAARADERRGAGSAGDAFVFLHADTRLPALADAMILSALKTHVWVASTCQIDARHRLLKLVALRHEPALQAHRHRYRDQAIFVRRDAFHDCARLP